MKALPKIITAFLVAASVCKAEPKTDEPLTLSITPFYRAETLGMKPEFVLMLGNKKYRTVEELKKGIMGLPRDTVVSLALGCIRWEGQPLTKDADIAKFREYCESERVGIHLIISGREYKKPNKAETATPRKPSD